MDVTTKINGEILANLEKELLPMYQQIDEISLHNHKKVLNAFHNCQISDYHLKGSTGYGYGDSGRDRLEEVYAHVLGAEKALVRGQIVSGTHAIALCFFGILKPGDELISITGSPYDTLEEAIGIRGNASGSLKSLGISYKQVELTDEGNIDLELAAKTITSKTKMITIQRSRGYAWRPSLNISAIKEAVDYIKKINKEIIIFADNCYGEFVEIKEPTDVGVDIIAGSLIKNIGGGLAPTGGYVAGKKELVDMAANRLTAPGIGSAVGASLELNRLFFQGLFMAPHIVSEAIKGAILTAKLFHKLGYEVLPLPEEGRTDIIQSIKLGTPDKLIAFCQGLQKGSPIDGHVTPLPSGMPGYEDAVIMAGGTFIQGSSIELSADGPLREPYIVFLQGGLSKEYTKLALISAAQHLGH